jgi:hypothetical protein
VGVSVVLAAALHVAAIALFASVATQWGVGAGAVRPVAPVWVSAVAAGATRRPPSDAAAVAPSASDPARAAPQPPAASASLRAPQAQAPSSEHGATRFYRIDEVESPAVPDVDTDADVEPDWNLNAALLDAAGLTRVAFDVFISSTGRVVSCELILPRDVDLQTRTLLENRVRRARLVPARRGGVPVASERRVEFTVLPSGN